MKGLHDPQEADNHTINRFQFESKALATADVGSAGVKITPKRKLDKSIWDR